MVLPSVLDCFLDSVEYLKTIRHIELFKGKWERCIVSTNTFNRSFKMKEAFLLNFGGELGSETAGNGGFMCNQATTCFLD